jgi:hypothetical protein
MIVNGCDCSIVIKTTQGEKDIPYSEETVREAVSILQEEASIEGDGVCRGIRKNSGVTGCVVTPLTLGTAPLLLYLAMGSAGVPVFVSESRNMYEYRLNLIPLEDMERFDLIQDRGGIRNEELGMRNERRLYEGCCVKGFELRILREEAIKLKLDICGERSGVVYPYTDDYVREGGERFNGDNVFYRINGKEYTNIYGLTISSKKEGGTKTELWIRRILDTAVEFPQLIDEITITAQLIRDKYEVQRYGMFRITLQKLVLLADETDVKVADAVISPLRYYVAGNVTADVFTYGDNLA